MFEKIEILDVEHVEESIIDKECADLLIKESVVFQEEFKMKTTDNEMIYCNTKNELKKSLMNPKIPRNCKKIKIIKF